MRIANHPWSSMSMADTLFIHLGDSWPELGGAYRG
jgi:hypothetical protein